jgi:hypothetical protein
MQFPNLIRYSTLETPFILVISVLGGAISLPFNRWLGLVILTPALLIYVYWLSCGLVNHFMRLSWVFYNGRKITSKRLYKLARAHKLIRIQVHLYSGGFDSVHLTSVGVARDKSGATYCVPYFREKWIDKITSEFPGLMKDDEEEQVAKGLLDSKQIHNMGVYKMLREHTDLVLNSLQSDHPGWYDDFLWFIVNSSREELLWIAKVLFKDPYSNLPAALRVTIFRIVGLESDGDLEALKMAEAGIIRLCDPPEQEGALSGIRSLIKKMSSDTPENIHKTQVPTSDERLKNSSSALFSKYCTDNFDKFLWAIATSSREKLLHYLKHDSEHRDPPSPDIPIPLFSTLYRILGLESQNDLDTLMQAESCFGVYCEDEAALFGIRALIEKSKASQENWGDP